MNIQDIANAYGVAVEDVAVRRAYSDHLWINQKRLCGGDMNTVPGFTAAGIKIPTHANSFADVVGASDYCKSCFKILSKKMVA